MSMKVTTKFLITHLGQPFELYDQEALRSFHSETLCHTRYLLLYYKSDCPCLVTFEYATRKGVALNLRYHTVIMSCYNLRMLVGNKIVNTTTLKAYGTAYSVYPYPASDMNVSYYLYTSMIIRFLAKPLLSLPSSEDGHNTSCGP